MSIIYKLWVWRHIAEKNSFGNVLCCKSDGLLQNCKERSCADDRVGGIRWQSSDFHDIRYSTNSQFTFRYIKNDFLCWDQTTIYKNVSYHWLTSKFYISQHLKSTDRNIYQTKQFEQNPPHQYFDFILTSCQLKLSVI